MENAKKFLGKKIAKAAFIPNKEAWGERICNEYGSEEEQLHFK